MKPINCTVQKSTVVCWLKSLNVVHAVQGNKINIQKYI